MIDRYPDPDDLDGYAERFGLERDDVIRDIARLVAIAYLCDRGFLNEDCVLVGGMGLRLRGSERFSVYDTDSSLRQGRLDEVGLVGDPKVDTDELEVELNEGTYWDRRTKLTIARPVNYAAYFAAADPAQPISDDFAFTVNLRGLNLPAEWFPLTSPYPELVFSRTINVPLMHLTEQTAEKAVGWAAASLAKHYLDLGWISREFHDQIDAAELRSQAAAKLKIGQEIYPTAYANLQEIRDLYRPLVEPAGYFGPLNEQQNIRAGRNSLCRQPFDP